jgi:rare lipoprotein A
MRRSAVSRARSGRCHWRPDPRQAGADFLGRDYRQRLRVARRIWIVTMMALILCIGGAPEASSRPHPAGHPSAVEGTASWYGWHQHGRRMANGQAFHALGSAAASSHLPLGSRVKVTNLVNHRVAWVTIKDREPATRGRVVDVSLGTARALGMEKQGLTKVRLEVAREPTTRQVRGPDLGTPKRRADHTVPGTHPAAMGRHGRGSADRKDHNRAQIGLGTRQHGWADPGIRRLRTQPAICRHPGVTKPSETRVPVNRTTTSTRRNNLVPCFWFVRSARPAYLSAVDNEPGIIQ